MNRKIVYIDTDVSLGTPGAEIDDGAALITLLGNPQIEIAGIGSVFGNAPLKDASANLDRLMVITGNEDRPLAAGAEGPLAGDMQWFQEWMDGYDATIAWKSRTQAETSAEMIVRLARTHAGKLTILSLGPMTNLALALEADPEVAHLVDQVIVMGGSFSKEKATPEFNIRCDPHAASAVFQAGWPLAVFGLEVTRRMLFTREMFTTLTSCNPAVKLLANSAGGWIDRVEDMGWEKGGCSLHDAVAAAYLLDPGLFKMQPVNSIEVELEDGPDYGTTRFLSAQNANANILAAVDVDSKACRELIWSRIAEA